MMRCAASISFLLLLLFELTSSQTLPVTRLNFHDPNLILGQRFRIWCDAKTTHSNVSHSNVSNIDVWATNGLARLRASQRWRLRDDWWRFEVASAYRVTKEMNGQLWHCFAAIRNATRVGGMTVESKRKRALVHYVEFPATLKAQQPDSKWATTSFTVVANPPAGPSNFSVVLLTADGKVAKALATQRISVRALSGKSFVINLEFRPQGLGPFAVRYRTAFIRKTSPNFVLCKHSPKSAAEPFAKKSGHGLPGADTKTQASPGKGHHLLMLSLHIAVPLVIGICVIVCLLIAWKRSKFRSQLSADTAAPRELAIRFPELAPLKSTEEGNVHEKLSLPPDCTINVTVNVVRCGKVTVEQPSNQAV